jgi:hypothetical protein
MAEESKVQAAPAGATAPVPAPTAAVAAAPGPPPASAVAAVAVAAANAAAAVAASKPKTTSKKKKRNNQDGKANKKKKKNSGDGSAPASSTTGKKRKKSVDITSTNMSNKPLVEQVLYRLTEGIPRMELKLVANEADDCEKALMQEIQMLEAALKEEVGPLKLPGSTEDPETQQNKAAAAAAVNKETTTKNAPQAAGQKDGENKADTATGKAESKDGEKKKESVATEPKDAAAAPKEDTITDTEKLDDTVNMLLENPLTPLDRTYFNLSALLGRLRDDLAIPAIRKPHPALLAATAASSASNKKKKTSASNVPTATYPQIVALGNNPHYTYVHPEPPTFLLQVWRKVASHRTAMVFRRPVKPEEAPGYADRILFPMDLSLIKKMISARIICTFSELHQRIRLISHNCVKYNGR